MRKDGMNNEVATFFFDTYAFFEIIRGNPKYELYKNSIAVTTIFNLAELNYGLKKELDVKTADLITEKYSPFLIEVTLDDIKEAMTFRMKNKELSIPDAVGYIIARKYKIKFLTGDEDFRNMTNVEFVKK